ncbi:hypothetical protein CLV30_1158 [Haloactinopolyspora alba]|uniref:Uncharacterized protein n=1 Tax=Haloactinopolyspora alba TaxID=648780 RepID=A0A2P8DV16_9ACTN|nr:hypothetical protein [Haloactinopolyspora alba]PSL01073.1 hypothetical protein CLV30_1158 [Haloactinopolyspora alba]
MFDTDDVYRLLIAGVVLLVGVGSCLAWISAGRRDPAGPAARVFMTVGLVMAALDFGGVGAVLGLSLAALGGLVAWEGQPDPEVPRPRRGGIVVAAAITGLATLAMIEGFGPLASVPEEARAVATVVVASTGALGTLAVADRARVTLRDALRRRFDTTSHAPH